MWKRTSVTLAAVIGVLLYVGGFLALDLYLNDWLYEDVSRWEWYHYITLRHGLAMLYVKFGWAAVLPLFLLVAVWAGWFAQKFFSYMMPYWWAR